jgi:hypothetical protein
MTNDEMAIASGGVSSRSRLVCFLYLLVRDHLPAGVIEEIMEEIEEDPPGTPIDFNNGWIAQYCVCLTQRLAGRNTVAD